MPEDSNLRTYFSAFKLFSNPRWLVISGPAITGGMLYWVGLMLWPIPADPRSATIFEPSPWMIATGILVSAGIAQFFVWKDEHQKGQKAEETAKEALGSLERDFGLAWADLALAQNQLEDRAVTVRELTARVQELSTALSDATWPKVSLGIEADAFVLTSHRAESFSIQIQPIRIAEYCVVSFPQVSSIAAGRSRAIEPINNYPSPSPVDPDPLSGVVYLKILLDANTGGNFETMVYINYTQCTTSGGRLPWISKCRLTYERGADTPIKLDLTESQPAEPMSQSLMQNDRC